MAGYDAFSKSNNAVMAENCGFFPASALARRLGVKVGAIKAMLAPSEWHHTSKYFNPTDYYSEEEGQAILNDLRAWKESVKEVFVFENCSGRFLEWTGTRNYRHARENVFSGIRVTKKGTWFTLYLPTGPIRKSERTIGFQLLDGSGNRLAFNR